MNWIKIHHLLGVLSIVVGLSYLFERYALVSKALQAPFALLNWLPGPFSGQQLWGLAFCIGGALILISWNIYLRAVCLIAGAVSWGFFGASSLFVSFVDTDTSERTGGYAGILATFVVFVFLWACSRIREDFLPPSGKVTS